MNMMIQHEFWGCQKFSDKPSHDSYDDLTLGHDEVLVKFDPTKSTKGLLLEYAPKECTCTFLPEVESFLDIS